MLAQRFANEVRTEMALACRQQGQLAAENNIVRRAGAMHEHRIAVIAEIAMGAHHGHQGRDTGAGRQEKISRGGMQGRRKFARRTQHPQHIPHFQAIMQPVRHLSPRHPLDRNGQGVRPSRRRRNRVAAVERFAVDVQLQRQELSGRKLKRMPGARAKVEALYIGRLLPHLAAKQGFFDVAVPR
ncbi:hypothetical protein D3C87_1661440 [compost metagenome]